MQILTQILTRFNIQIESFNSTPEIVIEGDKDIPKTHPLYGKKLRRHGTYTRYLKLYGYIRVKIIIYRFYCREERRTYSLLPFYISPYQRHINAIIAQVLHMHFGQGKSVEKICACSEMDVGAKTVKRWINKYGSRLWEWAHHLEIKLLKEKMSYRAASMPIEGIFQIPALLERKLSEFVQLKHLDSYGFISYLHLLFGF